MLVILKPNQGKSGH